MKKYFYLALGGVFAFIFGLIFYGAYINHSDEVKIAESMATRHAIPIKGAKATVRQIYPQAVLWGVDIFSKEKTDAVAMIDGRITSVNVVRNDNVTEGQTLFVLKNESYPVKIRQAESEILKAESEILKADNEIIKAETALANAKHELERYTRLLEREAVNVSKFEQVEIAFKEAQINLKNLRVQKEQAIAQRNSVQAQKDALLIESSYSNVTAPIDGEVLIVYRRIGSFVTAGTSLALIGNFRDLYFEMTANDKVVRQLVEGKKAKLHFPEKELTKIYNTEYKHGNKGLQQTFETSIVEITPSLDKTATIRKILWKIDNSSGILEPRTYNEIFCQSFLPRKCLTVPLTALNNQSKDALFVFTEDGTIKKTSITTGAEDGVFIEVISGLKEGDIVVESYFDNLTDGMPATFILEGDEQIGK